MIVFNYWWVFLLLPLPWVVRAVVPPRQERRVAVRVPFGDRIAEAMGRDVTAVSSAEVKHGMLAPGILWLLVLVATSRPQWIEPPVTRTLPTRDLLMLVDLSGSMDQEDFTSQSGQRVDRLTAVKEVLGEFLVRRQGDRVGLVVFGDAPYLQAPFSTDLELSRDLLDECEVGMAGPRTALGDAIGLGVNLFEDSDVPAKTILALTDGNDTKSRVPPVEAARIAGQREITIHTIAIGDPTTVGEDKLDEQALKEVASATGGSYFFANDRVQLEQIYEELDRIETREVKTISHRPRRDLYFVPLMIALFVSLAEKTYRAVTSTSEGTAAPSTGKTVHVHPITGQLELRP